MTASKFRSPKHLLRMLVVIDKRRKHLELVDTFSEDGDSFQVELRDDFIDDEISELEMKLQGIKKKLSDIKKSD